MLLLRVVMSCAVSVSWFARVRSQIRQTLSCPLGIYGDGRRSRPHRRRTCRPGLRRAGQNLRKARQLLGRIRRRNLHRRPSGDGIEVKYRLKNKMIKFWKKNENSKF